jgi:hypothetical protein
MITPEVSPDRIRLDPAFDTSRLGGSAQEFAGRKRQPSTAAASTELVSLKFGVGLLRDLLAMPARGLRRVSIGLPAPLRIFAGRPGVAMVVPPKREVRGVVARSD